MADERATIHLAPHFHYRPLGTDDQRACTRRGCELVQEYLQACQRDTSYHLVLSDLDYLQPFFARYSDQRELVRDLITRGRIETGGAYGQPHEMCLQGEAIIRNLLYGRLYQEGLLGAKPTVYLPLDVPGHCLQLPQIAAKAGFEGIIWSRGILGAPPLCYALAPDGTVLLQKREPSRFHPESLRELLDTAADGLEHQAQLGLRHDLRLLGGDMASPAAWLTGRSRELEARDPIILVSTPQQYMSRVKPEAHLRSAVIPVLGRDFGWYHMGTLVTRAELKIANRLAENRLFSAEKWATLAALLGARYPDLALDKAWRQVLFGQHHDAISGTCGDVPYLDLLACYREALDLAAEVEERSLDYIASRANTAGGKHAPREGAALTVFNSLSWTRTDVCRARVASDDMLASGFSLAAENGRDVPCQVVGRSGEGEQPWVDIVFVAHDVPSLGYHTYYLKPAREPAPEAETLSAAPPSIENEYFAVRADPAAGGGLTSIYDRRAKKELLNPEAGPANELIALAERPEREAAARELYTTGEMLRSSERPAAVSVLRGPVFSQLRIETELPDRCTVVQEVTLYQGVPRIDLRTTLEDYRGQHELLALSFPLGLRESVATFEDRFAAVVRKRSVGQLDFRTFEEQNLSHCGLASAQNWVDVGPGPLLSIMYGRRRVGAVPLGPCAVISARDLKHRTAVRVLEKALLGRGITCTHWLETDDVEADTGACGFRISLGRDNAYSQKVLADTPEAAERLAEELAQRRWAGVLVKRPDPQGQWPEVPVLVVDTSDPEGIPALAEVLAGEIRADELQIPESLDFSQTSLLPDDYGVALINRGSLAASLESDGTLVSLLFHSAPWADLPWGEGKLDRLLVPEHGAHVFQHALFPHTGDWRRGGVVRAGYEVNSPLIARQSHITPGPLPTRFSLVATDSDNLVITAVKPLGNPPADHLVTQRSDPTQGIVLRAYESDGSTASATIHFGSEPQEVWLADLMETRVEELAIGRAGWRRPASVALNVPACGIVTLVARLGPPSEERTPHVSHGGLEDLGPSAELARPTHCRYWEHNLGAAPVGNQPVTLWLDGTLPLGQNTRFSLGVSNDSRDQGISGTVEVLAPSEWTLIPRQVPFRIPAASQAVYEVMVIVPPDASPRFLRAVIQDRERELQDVLPIGEIVPLEAALTRQDGRFQVRLVNPNSDYVEGQVALITPLESWGPSVDTFALNAVTPRLHAFRLEAGAEQTFPFAVQGDMKGLWAVAKVMWYGRLQYVQEAEPA